MRGGGADAQVRLKMGKGRGCCSGDADDKELASVDPDIKQEAEKELESDEEYEPTGSGRIPGSKYTISEVDVLECKDAKALEKCVEKHKKTSRGESSCSCCCGCCSCGGNGDVLGTWKWVETLDDARKIIQ